MKNGCWYSIFYFSFSMENENNGMYTDRGSDIFPRHWSPRRIAVAAGEPWSTQFLFQRLSIAIPRGNAASVVGALRLVTDALTMCFICDVLCSVLYFVNI